MIEAMILLDTGPWVAYLARRDTHHDWAVGVFQEFRGFVTCEAVVAEVCARLDYYGIDPTAGLEFLRRGTVRLDFDLGEHIEAVEGLMVKYRDLPMDLADACLVRMSELWPQSQVLTTDKDFSVYRRAKREHIRTIRPPAG